ncbi:hypothetical protein [Dyadobacter chenhuakuii]|uniref:Uncharacterized protein n=1 Tax=Dyadobacter chenhuakuii TaxID=2909339 RepID=A0A9X1QCI7_9BACT|nr:hypothetical protein [Dyadobacter chenhuakuii]MCF2498509.1 hypothetical protein [Dyadobacter chenhuakuii]
MKTKTKFQSQPRPSGEEIIENKLREMNELLSKVDLSKLPKRQSTGQK